MNFKYFTFLVIYLYFEAHCSQKSQIFSLFLPFFKFTGGLLG